MLELFKHQNASLPPIGLEGGRGIRRPTPDSVPQQVRDVLARPGREPYRHPILGQAALEVVRPALPEPAQVEVGIAFEGLLGLLDRFDPGRWCINPGC